MHHIWLIIRREYLERVRTKSFVISTIVLPLAMAAIIMLPAKLAVLKQSAVRHLVIATRNGDYGEAIRRQLADDPIGPKYDIGIDSDVSESNRATLRNKVSAGEIDGYLWLSDDAIAARTVSYSTRDTNDFIEAESIRSALRFATVTEELRKRGASVTEVNEAVKKITIESLRIKRGQETKTAGRAEFISIIALVMLLYVTLLLSGVAVMRSVLEEKSSRVFEILLSSATAGELMAGKILGMGAVGLTQVAIWVSSLAILTSPALVAARGAGALTIPIQMTALPFFVIFYMLGYLLYSTMFAALGAMVNSEQEAQQWQMIVTLPLIGATILMMYVMRQPNSPLALGASLIPFFAPVLMYMRIVVQTPPSWQIGTCISLMLATMWGMVVLCARIYRIGILMYGKKPSLPEIAKWLRYAAR